jgi:hypothetical protein
MFKTIESKDIPKNIFRHGFKISSPNDKDIYFVLGNDFQGSLADYLDKVQSSNKNPKGVMSIQAIDDKKYFRITYLPNEITQDEIVVWLKEIL